MATYQILRTGSVAPTYTISDGTYSRVVLLNGSGLPPIRREITEHTYLSGAIDNGYHFLPREMTLRIFYQTETKALADDRRDAIFNIFQPSSGTNYIILRVTRNDNKIRQINCHVVGVMDAPESTRVGSDQVIDIRLLAPDPIWYDPTTWTLTATPSSGNQNFFFQNLGDWDVWPTIKVYGSVTGFAMTNILSLAGGGTRNYAMDLANVPAGDIYTIETHPSLKTVKNSAGVSVLEKISNLNLFGFYEFHLFGIPEAANGNNLINIFSTARDGTHKVQMIFQPRYLGL